ncbi:hypothetical protein [Nocardiopsis alba]|uniref:Uncharacterized protein n=1 Tax=Nocardiopsis alba TaxID=53437 RepID=A0A7K2ILC2_9ACTN|nr:hypothetical protein [Nocardiopsis alba]MYR30753.1 hypothetical protein [Nocardiopsis alba]
MVKKTEELLIIRKLAEQADVAWGEGDEAKATFYSQQAHTRALALFIQSNGQFTRNLEESIR